MTFRNLALTLAGEHYAGLFWLAWSMIRNPPRRLFDNRVQPMANTGGDHARGSRTDAAVQAA